VQLWISAVRTVAISSLLFVGSAGGHAQSVQPELTTKLQHLVSVYPDFLDRIDGNALVWKDGTRMSVDDGRGPKPFAQLLDEPDIKDMLAAPYPRGPAKPPGFEIDPGRVRYEPLFDKMYGDCRSGEVAGRLTDVVWLPKKWGKPLKMHTANGVAERLAAVSRELDQLPPKFDTFLFPAAGTYNCRPIAGTKRQSVHGHGIAIDIALKQAHYWQWTKPGKDGRYAFVNKIPMEIVEVFEKHGFIWGGRWYHYDTMHFEYRPELLNGN
jgi:D-alanyl-D-alanine carboxypeptidase